MAVLSCQDRAQQDRVAAGKGGGDSEVVLTPTALKGEVTSAPGCLRLSFSNLMFPSLGVCRRRRRRRNRHVSPVLRLSGHHHHGASR